MNMLVVMLLFLACSVDGDSKVEDKPSNYFGYFKGTWVPLKQRRALATLPKLIDAERMPKWENFDDFAAGDNVYSKSEVGGNQVCIAVLVGNRLKFTKHKDGKVEIWVLNRCSPEFGDKTTPGLNELLEAHREVIEQVILEKKFIFASEKELLEKDPFMHDIWSYVWQ